MIGQRQRDPEQDEGQVGDQFRDVGGQDVGEELADVGVDGAALLDGGDDAGEVVVQQHHVGGLAGDVGAAQAHGDADVGLPAAPARRSPRRRSPRRPAACASAPGRPASSGRRSTRANRISGASSASWSWAARHPPQARRRGRSPARRPAGDQADLAGDRAGGDRVVAGHHDDPDPGLAAARRPPRAPRAAAGPPGRPARAGRGPAPARSRRRRILLVRRRRPLVAGTCRSAIASTRRPCPAIDSLSLDELRARRPSAARRRRCGPRRPSAPGRTAAAPSPARPCV